MIRRTVATLALAAVGLAGLAACGSDAAETGAAGSGASGASGGLVVVATTTQLADFTEAIGGDRVNTVGLLKPNVDAHDYEASPADIDQIRNAKVIVRNGLDLDGWVDQAIEAAGSKATVVTATEGITPRQGEGEDDPHAWMDPRLAKQMVTTIAASLEAADPDGKAAYAERLTAYLGQIDALDAEIDTKMKALTNRKVVTNHDAFGYFLERYDLEFVGSVIPSVDTQAELSAAELTDLVAKIKAAGVKVIFTEASLPPKTAETIAAEAGVKVVVGDEALYGDSLGAPGSGAETYLTMMRKNAATFADNLG